MKKEKNQIKDQENVEKLIAKIDNNEKLTFSERNVMNIVNKRIHQKPVKVKTQPKLRKTLTRKIKFK